MLPAVGQESIWRGAFRGATIALAVGAAFMSCSLDSAVFAVSAADDPLGCSAQIYDPAAVAGPALAAAATTVATRIGADLHVRIERSLDGDIDVSVTLNAAEQTGIATATVVIHARRDVVWSLITSCPEALKIVSRTIEGGIHRYTYADAELRARKLAQALVRLGVDHGDRVASLAWNGLKSAARRCLLSQAVAA